MIDQHYHSYVANIGPIHDRCPRCHSFAIMCDHTDEYLCIKCYRENINIIEVNKQRREVDSISLYSVSSEDLKKLLRQPSIEIWD